MEDALELYWSDELLSADANEEIERGMHGCLDGKLPEEFPEAIMEPDCPLCAMLAGQMGHAADSWARWN